MQSEPFKAEVIEVVSIEESIMALKSVKTEDNSKSGDNIDELDLENKERYFMWKWIKD